MFLPPFLFCSILHSVKKEEILCKIRKKRMKDTYDDGEIFLIREKIHIFIRENAQNYEISVAFESVLMYNKM